MNSNITPYRMLTYLMQLGVEEKATPWWYKCMSQSLTCGSWFFASQRSWLFWDIFTHSPSGILLLMALATILDLEVYHLDVQTTFLRGDIPQEIYMSHSPYGSSHHSWPWGTSFGYTNNISTIRNLHVAFSQIWIKFSTKLCFLAPSMPLDLNYFLEFHALTRLL